MRARIALLLDTSRSMRFPAAPGGPSRAEQMLGWLKSRLPDLSALASRFQIDVYGFDKELQPQDPEKLAGSLGQADQLAQGPSTDILGALGNAAAAGTGGRPLAGLLVASDGADNAELIEGMTPQASAELQKLNAPVFVLPVGAQARARRKDIFQRVRHLLIPSRVIRTADYRLEVADARLEICRKDLHGRLGCSVGAIEAEVALRIMSRERREVILGVDPGRANANLERGLLD